MISRRVMDSLLNILIEFSHICHSIQLGIAIYTVIVLFKAEKTR